MSTPRIITTAIAAGLFATGLAPLPSRAQEEDRAPRSDQAESGQEVLTRGPVHEAFATAVTFDPEPGITISAKPPELIDELPPEQQLEGDNVAWIPGYWAWDEEREDFLWISGIWRNLPPDRQWVPGYWDDLGDSRYQWISGYWADSNESEVTYLPEPPKPLESRPNVDAPSSSDTWIPGNWVWSESRYRWRPGYWEPLRDNWTYVPDHYHWTPRGYVYIGGYWDYAPVRRGIIFAPVYFSRGYYGRPGFSYTPSIVISVGAVVDHLFVRPSYGHYYFGDYYEPRYRNEGFVASYSYGNYAVGHVGGYDPIYAYSRWSHRDDRDWDRRQREDFDYFRDNRDARPPRSWNQLRDLGDGRRGAKLRDKDYMVATPLAEFAKAPDRGEKFRKLDGDARQKAITSRKEMQDFRQERRQQEAAGKREGKPETAEKVKLGRSPFLGRRAADLGKNEAPPVRKQRPAPEDRDAGKDKTKPADERQRPTGEGDTKPMPPDREGRPQREREAKPEREPKPQKEGEATPQREDKPQREREAKPEREPKPQKEREAAPERQDKPQREREAKPEREPKPQKEREATPEREPKPQPKREVQPEPKREVQPQPKREVQPQPKREVQPQPKREVQPQPKREVQPQPKREVQPQPKREVQQQPKREAQPQREKPAQRKGADKDKEEKKE